MAGDHLAYQLEGCTATYKERKASKNNGSDGQLSEMTLQA